ncbi:MAG: PIN domain-containing protein [Pseudomonadota bacterium]
MNGNSLIIDANLLVLFIVGVTDRRLVQKHRRLKAFTVEDFDLLRRLIESSPQVLVTPNTLTETSNLLGYINEPARTHVFRTFRGVVRSTEEEYVQSRTACEAKDFMRLGLTDSALIEISNASRTLLTTDVSLYLSALNRGILAINFNHLREHITLK